MKHHGRKQVALAMLACAALFAAPDTGAKPSDLAGRPLLAVHEDPEPFLFQSPGRDRPDVSPALVGPVADLYGVFMTRDAQAAGGRRVIAEFRLQDPALTITEALGRESCRLVSCTAIVHQVMDHALTLSVRTTSWSVSHLALAWNRYKIDYKVNARLLDAGTDRVLASGEFVYSEKYDDAGEAPLLDDLLRDDAALLKSKFRDLEPLAAAELAREFEKALHGAGLVAKS